MPPLSNTTVSLRPTLRGLLTGRLFYVVCALMISVALLIFYFGFWVVWQATTAGESEWSTSAMAATNAEAEARLNIMKLHDQLLKSVPASDLERMEIALPTGPAIPELLVQMEGLSLESSMVDSSFTIETTKTGKATTPQNGPITTTASFQFNASTYDELKKVIAIMQKNLRLMDISGVNYDPSNGSVRVDLVMYYLPN